MDDEDNNPTPTTTDVNPIVASSVLPDVSEDSDVEPDALPDDDVTEYDTPPMNNDSTSESSSTNYISYIVVAAIGFGLGVLIHFI